MGTTPEDSINFLLMESASTSQIDTISESSTDIHLPKELITEILVRLPVKSLLRFKCVSKQWLNLISNPLFIKSHFSRSLSMDDVGHSHLQLLFITTTGMKKFCLYSGLHEADPCMHVSDIEFPAQNNTGYIVGIINGLVCLNLGGTNLCVWNPALNKIKHLNVYPEALSCRRGLHYSFSFGYEESNDDYKVVCLQCVEGTDGGFDAEVRIYSLKADSWRRINQLKGFYLPNPGVFANGKIYWVGDRFATQIGNNVSLDMSSEKFVEVQQPLYDTGKSFLKMGVSGGRLFMLCDYYKKKKLDLWVLDTHGVEESWRQVISMPYSDVDLYCFNYRFLCISSNGEFVFGNSYSLLVYNWKKKEYRNISLDVGITTYWGIAAYVESLVWPNYA